MERLRAVRAMMAAEQVTLAALENQAFALMSRLHVLMRREQGRVTDIEYMRVDPGYCRYVLALAKSSAGEDALGLCARLEEIYFGPGGLFPAPAKQVPPAARELAVEADVNGQASAPGPLSSKAKAVQSYVGRLR